jgi:hypothetical protein
MHRVSGVRPVRRGLVPGADRDIAAACMPARVRLLPCCHTPERDGNSARGDHVAMGNLSPELSGPVELELAKAVEQLPGQHGMPGGARYELKWDGFLH